MNKYYPLHIPKGKLSKKAKIELVTSIALKYKNIFLSVYYNDMLNSLKQDNKNPNKYYLSEDLYYVYADTKKQILQAFTPYGNTTISLFK